MICEVIRFTAYRDKCGPNIGLSVAHVIMSTVPSGAQTEIAVLYDAHSRSPKVYSFLFFHVKQLIFQSSLQIYNVVDYIMVTFDGSTDRT